MDQPTLFDKSPSKDDPVTVTLDTLQSLPEITRAHRKKKDLGLRYAAQDIGITPSTLHKFENRRHVGTTQTAILILIWIERG